MAYTRKLSNDKTTIKILWSDKDELSRFRLPMQRYKNQKRQHYEGDEDLIHRITKIILDMANAKEIKDFTARHKKLEEILDSLNKPNENPLSTYPSNTEK